MGVSVRPLPEGFGVYVCDATGAANLSPVTFHFSRLQYWLLTPLPPRAPSLILFAWPRQLPPPPNVPARGHR